MKKKTIFIVVMILLLGMAAAGCGDRNQQPQERTGGDTGEDVSHEDVTEVPTEQETGTPQVETENTNVSSITQEDLDKLKASIEGLEAEDLGGLSSD